MASILDGESLETAMHKVISNWLVHYDPIPEGWKQTITPIDAMPCSELLALGTTGCRQLASQSRSSLRRLQCLSETFSGLSYIFAEKFRTALENSYVVSNMCGLGTLPNELLVRIFECAVFGSSRDRWRTAISLSHVCRYFRDTILSCPQLWSDISGSAAMASLSLSRSKDIPLDVSIRIDTTGRRLEFDRLLPEARKHSKRWRTLTLYLICDESRYGRRNFTGTLDMSEVCRDFGPLDIPSLESLIFINESDFSLYEESYSFSQWDIPNLRYLNATVVPLSLRGLANVTFVDFTLLMDDYDYVNFIKGLKRMSSLEDLVLKLNGPTHVLRKFGEGRDQVFDTFDSNARHIKVEVDAESPGTAASMQRLFSPLSFPRAVSLEIKINGTAMESRSARGPYAVEEIDSILQHNGKFPSAEHFYLHANGAPNGIDPQGGIIYLPTSIDKLRGLKHLVLCSNRQAAMLAETSAETTLGSALPTHLPALETITVMVLGGSGASGFANFVADVLSVQKEGGKWEIFKELIVVADDREINRRGKRVTATYVGDSAFEWCTRHSFPAYGYQDPAALVD